MATWLEIGCVHAEQARTAGQRLSPGLSDAAKYTSLSEELQASLVAVTAFAFTFDGFYDTLRHELGAHPHQRTWKAKRTSRDAQLTETMRHHLKLGPRFSQQLRTVIKELFEFRSSAVHPSSQMLIRRAPSTLGSDSVKIGRLDSEVRRLCLRVCL